jgi:hypothetical protein
MTHPILLRKIQFFAFLSLTTSIAFFALGGCQTAGNYSDGFRTPASGHHAFAGSASAKDHTGSCTVCRENVTNQEILEHKAYACSNRHCIDRACLADQINSIANIESIEKSGLPCSGRVAGKDPNCGDMCKEHIPLSIIRELLEPEAREDLESRLAKAKSHEHQIGPKTDVQILTEGIGEAFNLCCPKGCGSGFGQIEGCTAATCSHKKCEATFCYLCLKPQSNIQAAHAHSIDHSDNLWEHRAGFTERYHWLIARKKLAKLFERDLKKWYHRFFSKKEAAPSFEKKVDDEVRESALSMSRLMLEERNMWPMPAGVMSDHWVEQVRNVHLADHKGSELQSEIKTLQAELSKNKDRKTEAKIATLQSQLKKRNEPEFQKQTEVQIKVELLQNEYIYRRADGDKKNAAIIKAELERLNAPVLASLDVKDSQGGVQIGVPWTGIPVMKDDVRVTPEFASLGNMYEVEGLIWSGVPNEKMNQIKAMQFCKSLGEGSRLPTREEYEILAKDMGYPHRYNADFMPDMKENWFWSSSLYGNNLAEFFSGNAGYTSATSRGISRVSVRCVRNAEW